MIKTTVPFKVAIGYVIVGIILGLAIWLMYGNTHTLIEVNKTSREYMAKRDIADSLVYSILEVSNNERSVCLGVSSNINSFNASIDRAISITRHLKALESDSAQSARMDTLINLLQLKRHNLSIIATSMSNNSRFSFYDKKLNSLKSGKTPVVIRPKTPETSENKEIVYEVIKPKKGFFSRLKEAFKPNHEDTVSIRSTNRIISSADSVTHEIDIADSVAGVLAQIKNEDNQAKRTLRTNILRKEQAQQIIGIQLASRTEQLLEDIRHNEQISLQRAIDDDLAVRHGIMIKIILLAIVAMASAIVLFYYVWRDIRQAKIYSENLHLAKTETERIMQQRERLLLTITHDIKAPAASISGFIELLNDYVDNPKAKAYLNNIHSSASHLLQLVGALLSYHQLENGKVQLQPISFSPNALITGCIDNLRPQANDKGIAIIDHVTCHSANMCRADAFRIRQILDNLINNAIKYTDNGTVTVSASISDSSLKIVIADTGKGMTVDECNHIFEAFTRLKDAQGIEGVGLGLSITKELVALLNGSISLQSEKGKGSTFTVTLPVEIIETDTEPQPAITANDIAQNHHIKHHNVLVLDDDALQLQLLNEMLNKISGGQWDITICQHVEDALAHLSSNNRPDILIMDIEMPEMNGTDLIKQISHNSLMIVGMTAHDSSIKSHLIEAGFDACLFKPFKLSDLASVLGLSNNCFASTSSSSPSYYHQLFAPLLAFAEGDHEAENEILENFHNTFNGYTTELKHIVASASEQEALSPSSRQAISRISHKALPVASMLQLPCIDALKHLAPENIATLPSSQIIASTNEVIADFIAITAASKNAVTNKSVQLK